MRDLQSHRCLLASAGFFEGLTTSIFWLLATVKMRENWPPLDSRSFFFSVCGSNEDKVSRVLMVTRYHNAEERQRPHK
jgi:hypothetical protein